MLGVQTPALKELPSQEWGDKALDRRQGGEHTACWDMVVEDQQLSPCGFKQGGRGQGRCVVIFRLLLIDPA